MFRGIALFLFRGIGLLLRMILWGFLAFIVSLCVLMTLGTHWHNNYEYYGKYPALLFGPTAVAFVAPVILVILSTWRRSPQQTNKTP